ncbi:TldD/PmbA family protein [Candidatus Micrarchaeota archaeon]|nr:TldD/PmbA family protein [Candidatus Micrarchaeota archaeon]
MPEHEIYSYRSDYASLAFTGGELKIKESHSACGHGIRVLQDGRLGFAYCQKKEDIPKAVEEAAKMARFSVRSTFSFCPQESSAMPDIHDPALDPSDFAALKDYVEIAKASASSFGGMPRVISSLDSTAVKLENSAGFSGEYRKTTVSVYIECLHADGFGFSYLSSTRRPEYISDAGLKAADMARSMHGAKKPEGGTYTVVAELPALESLLDAFLPSFSGDWKRRAITRLVPGRKMFSEKLTIAEDGLAPAIGARPFDDEGTPSARRVLVDEGVVRSFLYDRETAALEGVSEAGACSRPSYNTPPSISSSNIVLSPGDHKDLADIGRHIELHNAHGSHTANLTTGDIGLEASVAFLVENGERKPIKGFMLTANLFDMFANIEAMEANQKTYGPLIAPRIAFRDVRIVS